MWSTRYHLNENKERAKWKGKVSFHNVHFLNPSAYDGGPLTLYHIFNILKNTLKGLLIICIKEEAEDSVPKELTNLVTDIEQLIFRELWVSASLIPMLPTVY